MSSPVRPLPTLLPHQETFISKLFIILDFYSIIFVSLAAFSERLLEEFCHKLNIPQTSETQVMMMMMMMMMMMTRPVV